ncbi:MAG: triose-phosphate isomerase [Candidatus Omnitrophota bacterium]
MRKVIIAGNWKMNKTVKEAVELVNELNRSLYEIDNVEIVVCPPFTALETIADMLNSSNIKLGAQNMHWEISGAYTGEISGQMLKELGVENVIIGHSERRQFFGESDETINKKIKAALKIGLTPIFCVGENLNQREKNLTLDIIRTQVEGGLKDLTKEDVQNLVIAYEPVWAIGTGKTATSAQAQEVHKFIRELLVKNFGDTTAQIIRIQYGGSVKPANIKELISQPDIDGALVGGASLDAKNFIEIVNNSKGVQ